MRPGPTVPGYPRRPARYSLDQVGEGVRTGPQPGRDNAGIIEDAFRRADPGDVIVGAVDHDGDPNFSPQLTFLDRPITVKIPTGVTKTGPNDCPTAQGYVRRHWVSDWRQSVFPMASGSVLSNTIIYLHTDYSAGYPFGVVTAEDEFDISLSIRNCQATYFGDGPGRWSGIISLDASAGNYAHGGRGTRDFRIHDVLGWGYDYRGVHIAGGIGGVIDGLCLTRMSDKPGVLDLYVGGQAATPDNASGPSYKVQLRGPQLGTSCYLNDADRVLIEAPDIDNVNLAGRVTNSRITSQVPAVVAVYGADNINNFVNGKPYP